MKFVSGTQSFFRTCFLVDLSDGKQTADNFCFLHGDDCNSFSFCNRLFHRFLGCYSFNELFLILKQREGERWFCSLILSFFRPVKLARFNLSFQFTIGMNMTLVYIAHCLFLSYIIVGKFFYYFTLSYEVKQLSIYVFPIEVILLLVHLQVPLIYLYFHEIHLTLFFWILKFLVLVHFLQCLCNWGGNHLPEVLLCWKHLQ